MRRETLSEKRTYTVAIGLQSRIYILHCPFDKDTADQAETLAVRIGLQCLLESGHYDAAETQQMREDCTQRTRHVRMLLRLGFELADLAGY